MSLLRYVTLVGLFLLATSVTAEPYKAKPGTFTVTTELTELTDTARNRTLPVKIYAPKSGAGPFPVVLFSHGLGGSREAAIYLGEHWASHGYVSIHVQHPGSDESVWKGKPNFMKAMREAVGNIEHAINRPRDIRFVIDELAELDRSHPTLKGRLDRKRLGVAGHSFGSYTTMAVGGLKFVNRRGREFSFGDPRIKAIIPLSPTILKERDRLPTAMSGIRIPVLYMSGTKDDSPINDAKAADRPLAYKYTSEAEAYFINFDGADHMVFSGRKVRFGDRSKDPKFHNLIQQASVAFWDAYLKEDSAALHWLREGGLKTTVGDQGTVQQKRPKE